MTPTTMTLNWSSFQLVLVAAVCFLPPLTQSFVLGQRGAARMGLSSCSTPSGRRERTKQQRGSAKNETCNDRGGNEGVVGRREFASAAAAAGLLTASSSAAAYAPSDFERVSPIQFIAALGDPAESEGNEAGSWGLWKVDPGPRGVMLKDYERDILKGVDGGGEGAAAPRTAPAGWRFDSNNWWLEEHGLIMESPDFPLSEGKYLVTGGRKVTTVLTVSKNGRWSLEEGTLFDVTHLPCRSACYTPNVKGAFPNAGPGSPRAANRKDFPVSPGAAMPNVKGATKQDYAVLFVVGKAT